MNDMFEPNKTYGILYWNGIMEVEGSELNRKIERERIEKMSKKYMDIQEKVVNAVLEMQKGSPLRDFLTDAEIEEALSMFADVLVTLGITVGEE